ncbi:hypothetical protein A3L22_28735 [Streptomyces griseus subsp. griseus]|nr:hypothetical protein A3L22_28735 [Streptomyces griseus subsp. griseus]
MVSAGFLDGSHHLCLGGVLVLTVVGTVVFGSRGDAFGCGGHGSLGRGLCRGLCIRHRLGLGRRILFLRGRRRQVPFGSGIRTWCDTRCAETRFEGGEHVQDLDDVSVQAAETLMQMKDLPAQLGHGGDRLTCTRFRPGGAFLCCCLGCPHILQRRLTEPFDLMDEIRSQVAPQVVNAAVQLLDRLLDLVLRVDHDRHDVVPARQSAPPKCV